MSNTVKLRRSSIALKVPTLAQLSAGELAMNTTDEKLYASSGTSVFEILTSKYSFQLSDDDLTAYANLATTGLVARTGSGSAATRAIEGTANQIAVVNGDAVAGNPAVALVNNPVLPGVGSVTIPSGTTAERPASPTLGMVRHNSTLSVYEVWNGLAWLSLSTHQVLTNGMPAYIEPTGSVLTSVDSTSYAFAIKSNGTRNVYLSILGDIASSLEGYMMPRNALVRAITLMASSAAVANASFEIRVNGSTTPTASYLLATGQRHVAYVDLSVPLANADEVAIYLNSASNVVNPICLIEIGWRN